MLDSILDMLQFVLSKRCGEYQETWFSDTLKCSWRLSLSDHNLLSVECTWIDLPYGLAASFPKTSCLSLVRPDQFLAEWKRPLAIVLHALTQAGYTSHQIAGVDRLKTVVAAIASEGRLYSSLSERAWEG